MTGLCGKGFVLRKTPLKPDTGGHARCLAACLLLCLQLFLLFSSLAKGDLRPRSSRSVPPVPAAELSIAGCLQHICEQGARRGTAFHLPTPRSTQKEALVSGEEKGETVPKSRCPPQPPQCRLTCLQCSPRVCIPFQCDLATQGCALSLETGWVEIISQVCVKHEGSEDRHSNAVAAIISCSLVSMLWRQTSPCLFIFFYLFFYFDNVCRVLWCCLDRQT